MRKDFPRKFFVFMCVIAIWIDNIGNNIIWDQKVLQPKQKIIAIHSLIISTIGVPPCIF